MKKLQGFVVILLIASAGACSAVREGHAGNDEDQRRHTGTPASGEADKTVVEGNNRFGLELYGALRGQAGNLFLSPFSISSALAMTYAGARGETARQMAATLHFDQSHERLHSAFGSLAKQINGDGGSRKYELSVANALWRQQGLSLVKQFQDTVSSNYGAALEEADFQRAPDAARNTINGWVERQTHEKIKDLIGPNVLSPQTRLVLVNAIYFKGNWASQFNKESTRDDKFFTRPGQPVTTPFMHQEETSKYYEGETLQVLELPYIGKELSMLVLLPRTVDGLGSLERSLTAASLGEWSSKMYERKVTVILPKFKLTRQFELAQTLSGMGMPLAFSDSADFSMLCTDARLAISKVIHKAFVDVNEEGTEAAAATGTEMRVTSVQRETVFRADHPFVFMIRDNKSGSILFIGRVTNPQQ
ncbi:MAG TPA: serpin family protein [Blastocatellia bacterium]|nr:serpin family protein [Blastocatellia bacterium]